MQVKNFQVSPTALLSDPAFYLFDFDTVSQDTRFLLIKENQLSAAAFADIRYESLALGQLILPINTLLELEAQHNLVRKKAVYIFHHAFVCSTLLARCLNQIDAFYSLKEPWILRRLADFKRHQKTKISAHQWQKLVKTYLALLPRNYRTGNTTVIKATNVANNLIKNIAAKPLENKLLYLYSDIQSFLVSNLKKPRQTQQKIPDLINGFLLDSDFLRKYPDLCSQSNKSFLSQCALLWVINLYNFRQHTQRSDHSLIKTLEMSDFLTNMESNLAALSLFYGHRATAAELKLMLDPKITMTNAKDQQLSYSTQQKQSETALVLQHYQSEIRQVIHWINPVINELELLEYCHDLKLR